MIYEYRYLQKKYIALSFVLVFSSLLVAFCGAWFGIISNLPTGRELGSWKVISTIVIIIVAMAPFWFFNEKLIAKKCIWDKVSINKDELISLRYGNIPLNSIKRIKVNDLSKVFSFYIIAENRRLTFSCLSFLGNEGGSEYKDDKKALLSISGEILSLANHPEYYIKVGNESGSSILFSLSCLTMILLIPGLIYAPQRMIFVIPFVVPLFFILLKNRRDSKK